ncbi:LOW QUALITY PROTEIN: receptor-like protein EIX2 [Camellia sinensis]|uniref:LOW QUALITY PROTEIN: receptor-like protein EIX2 n=1 Tax=Camellia sinensis TaxID=4442 RepID=UPI0010369581|nr:LOW QUALITY PROTEIN: receptor-like protein EIX2 [Camellia sinensis]
MERVPVIGLVMVVLSSIATEFVCYGNTHLMNCSEPDLQALIDFKNGLNDPDNRLSSWQSRSNCCQWRGIGCDNSTGAVIAIDLRNPYPLGSDSATRFGFWNLSGEIRPSLLQLKSLKHLDLSSLTFQDIPIPSFFGSLKNLQYLNLSKAGFIGKIPPSLGNLSSLQYLDVSYDFLSVDSLQWVTGLVSLKHLQMNGVDLSMVGSNWIEVLNSLSCLTELHLSLCGLSSFAFSLSSVNFTSLAVVDFSFNSFNSEIPDWFANLSSLVYVDITSSTLRGRIPLGFSELPSLKYLNLDMNNNLSAGCEELFRVGWGKIEVISLASNKVHGKLPSSIGNMTFLTDFLLFLNNVEGGIPSSIGRLCNLRNFDLMDNNLTGSLPEFLEGIENCGTKSPLPNLMHLELSNNKLVGKLPEWLGQLENLVGLGLSNNLLEGPILASLGTLQNLTDMGLEGNKLNGTLPVSFGHLSELHTLDISYNQLTGVISETHFATLSKLKILTLASNSFVLNVSSNWVPPFKVINLDMGSCQLGPSFPAWLKSQKELQFLNLPNTSISGSLPSWFWDISSNLSLLNVSFNQLKGQLPNQFSVTAFADIDLSSNLFEGPIPLPTVQIELLDLSNNHFSGSIPHNISNIMPDLIFLSFSGNQLSGEIPESIGQMSYLQVISLSSNHLTGSIPSSIWNCTYLKVLDLGNNNLSGVISGTLGELKQLQSLHLSNNKLTGEIPSSFQNLSSLETLDLGNNKLSGHIPPWFGNGFPNLRIISLRSNAFSGGLSSGLSNLSSLQVLDLAENNLTAQFPASLGDLKAMVGEQKVTKYLFYGKYRGRYYEESLVVNTKGKFQKYTKTLSLVIRIDLSSNNLYGEFPVEITKLTGLVVLNLSRNQISGQIPEGISSLQQLGSLDLSSNRLSGAIPPSKSSLSFLGYLNLSNNDLTGMIPDTGQMSTFDESCFDGNPGLCGVPLTVTCSNSDSDKGESVENDHNDDGFIDQWFYLSVGLGFAAGLLVPCLVLASRKPWSDAYLSFVDKIVYRLPWARNRGAMRHRKQRH